MVAVKDTARNRVTHRTILSEATGEVHWNAVIAGVVVALATQILLTVLAVALGAATFEIQTDEASATAGRLAYAWWSLSRIAAAFAGGWTAGNVSAAVDVDRFEGAFQGFLSWAVALIFLALLLVTSAGGTGVASRFSGPLALQSTTQHAAAIGAIWAFAALLIGAGAALLGGYFGASHVRRILKRSSAATTLPREGKA